MKFHFNLNQLKNRRKDLRRRSTEGENVLWQKVRNNKLEFKFFRQYSVDGYVIDFYCPKRKLAVEIDGGYHKRTESKTYDKYRERYLKAFNIRILRFKNNDVMQNSELVVKRISDALLLN